jgi:zinc protease
MAFRQAYFGNHPWSQSVDGRRSEVENITPDTMQKFHFDHLGADQSVLAIFGDVDEQQALAEAQKLFGSLPTKAAVPFVAKEPQPQVGRVVEVKTVKPTPAVQIGYGPGLSRTSPDYPAMLVMNRVLSSFPVGWFDQSLRGTHGGLVYAVGAGVFTGAARGYWAVLFNTGPHDVEKTVPQAMERALGVVQRIRSQMVDDHTLADARTAVLVGEALGRQSAGDRAAIASLDELYGLGYDEPARFIQQIRNVTAKDVHDVADRYLGVPLAVVLTPVEIPEAELPSLHPAPAPAANAPAKPAEKAPAKPAASK